MKQSEWDYHGKKFWNDIKPLHKTIKRVHLLWLGFILFLIIFVPLLPYLLPESFKSQRIANDKKDVINTQFYGRFVGTKPAGHGSNFYLFSHDTFRDKILRVEYFNQNFFNNLVIGDSVATFKGDSIITVFKNGEKIIYPKLNSD